jgi:hypothetical protein
MGRFLAAMLLALAVTACIFPESSFTLARESRLPKWIKLPEAVTRADVDVIFDYFQRQEVKIKVLHKRGKTLLTLTGKGTYLAQPARGSAGGLYPAYKVVVVNGIPDIVEHRAMEPIVYMTDDPAVWKALGLPVGRTAEEGR